ncbi:MAG TPA: hypothetical protein VKZ77_08050 [Bacillaceae bacterium]|nr:hypothetical protein [Paenibacillus bovis]HLU22423.1 hypothetical protein [Bacillaceae bacterium]
MHNLTNEQVEVLNRLSVTVSNNTNGIMSLDELITEQGSNNVFELIMELNDAPTKAVATSVYFRRHGFFITAFLQLLCVHNIRWIGALKDIHLIEKDGIIHFAVTGNHFVTTTSINRESDIRFILEHYGHAIVEPLSKLGKVSKLILWENIWGYVIWMYSQLYKDESIQVQAEKDLEILLSDDLWKPTLRRSPFRQYLKNDTIQEAMDHYKRLTCCLYKELPNTDKCPYCPLVQKT